MSALQARADNWSDLRGAVYYGKQSEVARLLDSGVDINLTNEEGWTALHVAAEQGDIKLVNYLLARGADPSRMTTRGKTPFDVSEGYGEVRQALKARMANPAGGAAATIPAKAPAGPSLRNGPNDGRTASTRARLEARDAVWYNNPSELTALLDAGLDVNALDDSGRETLLHAAAGRDRVQIVRLLLARGADKSIADKDGKLPVDYAQSPEMRALLGGAKRSDALAAKPADQHCKSMWHEATALCGIGNSSCNTSAHIRYQSCLKKGTWY